MKNNPFATRPSAALAAEKGQTFITSSWQQHADLVNHLCLFSQNVLLVLAPQGGGKTTFAQHCQHMAVAGVRKLVVKAQANEPIEDILKKMVQGFGMTWQGSRIASDQIRGVIEEANRQQATWVVFIDDAHLLSNEHIKTILQLIKFHDDPRKQLHLVLLGEPSLELRLFSVEFTPYVHGKIYTIELESWTLPEVEDYLNRQGQNGLAATELSAIFERSRGLPGYVVREMNVVEPHEAIEPMHRKPAIKWGRHPVTFGLCLGVLVGGTYLIVNNQTPEEASTVALALAPPAKKVDFQFAKTEAAPAVAAPAPTTISAPAPTLASNAPTMDLDPPPPENPEENAEPELALNDLNELKELTEVVSSAAPVTNHVEVVAQAPKKIAATKAQKVVAKTLTKSHLAPVKVSAVKTLKAGYTLQLLGSRNEGSIKQFVQQHHLQSKAHTLHTQRGGEDWYIVVYGEYPSQDAARAAIKSIPSSLKRAGLQPWVRPMQAVQADVRSKNG